MVSQYDSRSNPCTFAAKQTLRRHHRGPSPPMPARAERPDAYRVRPARCAIRAARCLRSLSQKTLLAEQQGSAGSLQGGRVHRNDGWIAAEQLLRGELGPSAGHQLEYVEGIEPLDEPLLAWSSSARGGNLHRAGGTDARRTPRESGPTLLRPWFRSSRRSPYRRRRNAPLSTSVVRDEEVEGSLDPITTLAFPPMDRHIHDLATVTTEIEWRAREINVLGMIRGTRGIRSCRDPVRYYG